MSPYTCHLCLQSIHPLAWQVKKIPWLDSPPSQAPRPLPARPAGESDSDSAWAASSPTDPRQLFAAVLEYVPQGETRTGILRAADLPLDYDVRTAVFALGNGTRVLSQDTVPFALWCAARHLHDFEEAMWSTVSGLGDRDTTCAIVGGIVAMAAGDTLPTTWLADREPLATMEG
jgi:hypothetical protein